jgi:glucose/arabinose dehydrogenase
VEPAAQFQADVWAASSGSTGVWFKGFRGSPGIPVDASVSQVVTATVSGDYTLMFDAKVEEFFPDVISGFRVTITSDGTGGSRTINLLNPSTREYELRVRYRDDVGSVSSYATRRFHVGATESVFPLELSDVRSAPAPEWLNAAENDVVLPPAAPNQSELRLEAAAGDLLLSIRGGGAPHVVTSPAPLADHADLRVVVQAGSNGLTLGQSTLTFQDDHGQEHTVCLPAINLAANQRLDLWVASEGSTYFGTAAQTEPDFSDIARRVDLPVPFLAMQPGFVVEEVAGGFQLPTNIAFVPNPGPDPDDPLFYVTELYGTIKVVTNDFTVSNYATGLLNFNPTGAFPGSGEQGLAGIVVDPLSGDVFVTRVTDSDGIEGGIHHPQVVRLHSTDGGRTASSTTVIRNMVGESQGQSHQISNITIGPDGKLYVHVGDGFDYTTAQNLDSYRGKILRMNLDGTAPADNPFYNASFINARDYVYAYGVRNPFGGAWRAADGKHYEVENGPSIDRFAQINRGVNYGWNNSDASMMINAIYNWNPAHAPVNIAFVEPATFGGSDFPAWLQDMAFVSESGPTYATGPQERGKRIVQFQLNASGALVAGPTPFVEYVGTGKGSVVGLAAGPDGLYFTELYKDLDAVTPIDAGARVIRVRFAAAGNGDFNEDGSVDTADYVVWRKTLGNGVTAYSGADGDGDGTIDQDDLNVWRAHFGETLGVGAGAAGSAGTVASASAQSQPANEALSPPVDMGLQTAIVADEPTSAGQADDNRGLLARDRALAGFASPASFGSVRRAEYRVHRTHHAEVSSRAAGTAVDFDTLLLTVARSTVDDDAKLDSGPAGKETSHERSQHARATDSVFGELKESSLRRATVWASSQR